MHAKGDPDPFALSGYNREGKGEKSRTVAPWRKTHSVLPISWVLSRVTLARRETDTSNHTSVALRLEVFARCFTGFARTANVHRTNFPGALLRSIGSFSGIFSAALDSIASQIRYHDQATCKH